MDDSRFLRLANERSLIKIGHNVISASDGEEGLRLAIEHQPDLIVLDMMLPKLSGLEVLRACDTILPLRAFRSWRSPAPEQ